MHLTPSEIAFNIQITAKKERKKMTKLNQFLVYDELPLWSAPFGLTLLDTIRMRSHINVLDIGSGSGFPMLELAERLGKTSMVYGLDPSQDAIDMITTKKELKGIFNARIIQGVAEEIPFPDEYFGLIVANNGLNNVADQRKALEECYRVSEKGSQMVLTMNLPHTMVEFYDAFEETLMELGLNDEVGKMHLHISDKRKPVDYLKELILSRGFVIKTINVDGFKIRYHDGTSFFNHYFIRKAFMGPWKAILPGSLEGKVMGLLEEKLNRLAEQQGELTMSVPYVCFDCSKP